MGAKFEVIFLYRERQSLKRCLNALNDRRTTALEPLHSLRRLIQAKRKYLFENEHLDDHPNDRLEYLNLANIDLKKKPNKNLANNPNYKVDTRYIQTYILNTVLPRK